MTMVQQQFPISAKHSKFNWSRSIALLSPGALIKLIDYEGNYNILRIGRKEPMGDMITQFTTGGDSILPGGVTEFADFRFVEPAQEGRLFHYRPILFAVRRADGRFLFPNIPDMVTVPAAPAAPPDDNQIPMGVAMQVKHPNGTWRFGTDFKRDVVVTTPGGVTITSVGVGGVDGGFIEAPLAPFLDDPSSLWDMFTLFGHTLEVRIVNRTDFFWPPGFDIGGGNDNKDYFVGLFGAKYLLLPVKQSIKDKVMKREVEYTPVVIGGIPTVTTKA